MQLHARVSASLDPESLIAQLSWQLAATIAMALALGAIGGSIPRRIGPSKQKDFDETVENTRAARVQRALVGAVAAAAVLFVTDIATPLQLICGSLVAGYAGNAVMESLEARLVAVLAEREVRATNARLRALDTDARQLAAHVEALTSPTKVEVAASTSRAVSDVAAMRKRHDWQ